MKKLKSRKFVAWIFASLVLIYLAVTESLHLPIFIPWWGGITMVWLGVQGGADMFSAKNGGK